jgi:hypothetical protein
MPDDEIGAIFGNGFKLLGIQAPDDAVKALVYYADGFPFFAHLLGLNVARVLLRPPKNSPLATSSRKKVTETIIDAALRRASKEVEQSFEPRVRSAFEAGGNVRPRRRILELMAYSEHREMLSNEIVSEYSERFGEISDPGFLHAALGQLVQEKYGTVLRRDGPRGRYTYKFNDPQMRPYLRIRHFPLQLSLFG